jgi:hypothetical protein
VRPDTIREESEDLCGLNRVLLVVSEHLTEGGNMV